MGLFGKKKKKKFDDFSDEGEENGFGGDRDGDMPAFQGSDDNPYADDPAHKHFVKLLDSNGLVRHRRAFIRNSVYHVGQAKNLDADRLKNIGVFLEADRKKLLRIFNDAEVVESEVDKQREQEKMDMERQQEEEEEEEKASRKKKKKDKKGKKDKKKKKKKHKDSEDEGDDDLGLSDEDEKPKKKKKKKKKGKDKGEDEDDLGDLDDEEDEGKPKKKGKKGKKDKKGGKKKKKDKKEKDFDEEEPLEDDLDDFGEEVEEKEEKPKKSKGKKGKNKKDKKGKKGKKSKKEKEEPIDDFDEDLDAEITAAETDLDMKDEGLTEEELYTPQPDEEEVPESPKEETREVVIKELDKDIKETEKKRERRMSHGSQALKMLNEKLGGSKKARRSSLASTNSRQKPRSVATVDEEEELWWKDLGTKDKNSTGRRISFTDESSEASAPMKKKGGKVKAQYGSNVEYLTAAEHEVLKNFRKQRKVTRRQRPTSHAYYEAQSMPSYNMALPPPMPPPIFKNHQGKPETNLQPPGEATHQASAPNSPNNAPAQPNMIQTQPSISPNPYQFYYPPPPMPYLPAGNMYYDHPEEEEEKHSDGASTIDFSKYKYYKERYNKRKKEKKRRKMEAIKEMKRKDHRKRSPKKHRKSSSKEFVDVSKELNKDSELWPVRSEGDLVNDTELNAESSDHETRVQRYGNDDYYFNYNTSDTEQQVKKGSRGKNRKKHRVNYFASPSSGYESENNDSEMYILRKKLAEIGASRFYPILIKYGIMSLKHCTMSKLEKLPIASRSKKAALIRAIMQVKKGSRNRKSLLASDLEFSDSSVKEIETKKTKGGKLGLKSSLKQSSLKEHQRKRKVGTSKAPSGRSRHYFTPGSISLAESDNEPDHVKVVKKVDKDDAKSQDKKSVTFDLKDEDEISLPSYSDIEENSDSEISINSYE